MAKNKKNNNTEFNEDQVQKEVKKQASKEKLKVINEALEKKIREKEAKKAEFKQLKQARKQTIAEINKSIKIAKQNHQQQFKDLKCEGLDRQAYEKKYQELRLTTNEEICMLKNERAEINFNFGQTHQTLIWKLTKWTYGLRKEFRHIIWSHPSNTFKYLLIIVLIVGIFAILFFAIDNIIKFL